MPINSRLWQGWKSFLQFCYSIPTLLMQNTNLYRYFQRYVFVIFAIFVHYVFRQTITIMLLFCYSILLKVLRMEVVLTWRNLITFYLYWKYRLEINFKIQTKFSFHSHKPFYYIRQPWTKYIGLLNIF